MGRAASTISLTLFALSLGLPRDGEAASNISIPLNCSKGPSDQRQKIVVTIPASAAEGSNYKVRIDGVNSGKVSHTGLNHIFDMWYEWPVPRGTQYVEGSARIIANTGTENVRRGARIVHQGGVLNLVLPAHVDNGSNYTPPSFEFALKVTAPGGATVTQTFRRYRVTANAFLIGDVHTTCDPKPKPFPVATTKIEPGASGAKPNESRP
jgi:hypothetical protein